LQAEHSTRSNASDPHLALYEIALERGFATLPEGCSAHEQQQFAEAFRRHALLIDPDWPLASLVPTEGAMFDALGEACAETVQALRREGRCLELEGDDCVVWMPPEEWERAADDALRTIRRPPLVRLLAPSGGGRQLAERVYRDISVAELAEDLAAWTERCALPRGQLSPEAAAGALLLWLSPAACDDVDAVVHVLANDPFVGRATRYAALRLAAANAGAGA
jgi:hypothetical protein